MCRDAVQSVSGLANSASRHDGCMLAACSQWDVWRVERVRGQGIKPGCARSLEKETRILTAQDIPQVRQVCRNGKNDDEGVYPKDECRDEDHDDAADEHCRAQRRHIQAFEVSSASPRQLEAAFPAPPAVAANRTGSSIYRTMTGQSLARSASAEMRDSAPSLPAS